MISNPNLSPSLTKAVVSSGYSDSSDVAQYRKHGFKAFLKKPYNIEELKDALYGLL